MSQVITIETRPDGTRRELLFEPCDTSGLRFDNFMVKESVTNPGWFIYGRHPEYGLSYIMICGRPNLPRSSVRSARSIFVGWESEQEAREALAKVPTDQLSLGCEEVPVP